MDLTSVADHAVGSPTRSAALAAGLLREAGVAGTAEADHRVRAASGGYTVDCAVGWAGPVALPLSSEDDVQAACGIMAVHGRRTGTPTALCVPYTSTAAGVLAAQGVLAALIDQHRGGHTSHVTTSAAQAALLTIGQYLATATTDDPDHRPSDGDIGTGGKPPLFPAADGGREAPPFTAADGVRFEVETFEAEDWQRFWTALGAEPTAIRHGWRPFQSRYATATCPLPDDLARAASRHPFEVVHAAGAATGMSVVALRNDPTGTTGPTWRVTPLAVSGRPSPDPRTGRRSPGMDLGRPWSGPQAGRPLSGLWTGMSLPGSAPLRGFRVVEATSRVQGPLAGHLLRLLGAEVIRLEPPDGDPLRGVPPMAGATSARFRALNDGKRVVRVDLRSTAGRDAVRELVADADVFLHNWAPGRDARYRLADADLVAASPDLVYAHASGWGDALGADPPKGTDFLVQAHSGLAARVWPDRVAPSLLTLTDVLGGLVCVTGVLAALLDRLRAGGPRRVDSSLLSAAGLLLRQPPRPPEPPRVPVSADLAELATDPRFAAALDRRDYTAPRSLWGFGG